MAYLRFSRDSHGYEHFQLVEPITRRGRTRTRVLYWFRSPPGIKVGRDPFDDETRRALEARYPSVTFDWRRIVETPIPSADAEKWRERRREERIARRAKKVRDGGPPESEPEVAASDPEPPPESDEEDGGDAGEPSDPSTGEP